MIDADSLDRLIKALESIADSLGYLAPISEQLESLGNSAYELNEKIDRMTGDVHGGSGEKTFLRTLDIGSD